MKEEHLKAILDIQKNDLFFMHSWLIDQDYIEHIPFNTRIFLQMSYCYKKTNNIEDYTYDFHQCINELMNESKRNKHLDEILQKMYLLHKKNFYKI